MRNIDKQIEALEIELATEAAVCNAKTIYNNFYNEVYEINPHLVDGGVDHENAIEANIGTEKSVAYWEVMLASAIDGAAGRAEERGFDINNLLGRVVY